MNRSAYGFSRVKSFLASVLILILWIPIAYAAAVNPSGSKPVASDPAKAAMTAFDAGPSVFIENTGQWTDKSIRFALDGHGANVGLTDQGPRFQLLRRTAAPAASEMHEFGVVFDGAARVAPEGRGKTGRTFNYLMGDAANHREGVPAFNTVWYGGLYPGVDLELTGQRTGIKYNFHVAPGADWRMIRVKYDGIDGLSLRPDGALDIRIANGWDALTDGVPCIYQEVNGEKRTVAGKFTLVNGHTYGFEVTGAYDATLPLVIDPSVVWGTYLGGADDDRGIGIAVDPSGNVYVTGGTKSSGWVSGGWDTTFDGPQDAYVVKLSAAGAHAWSTYLGGTGDDRGCTIAVDPGGNVYVTGDTYSSGWVSGGWISTYGGNDDGFVVKLSPAGAHLWSTYLGGTGDDMGTSIALDSSDNVYVTGYTSSPGWVSGGWQTTLGGTYDAFAVKLSTAGVHLWSTYLGGTGDDFGFGIASDSSGNAYVTGNTNSPGWVSGGWQTTYGGGSDDGFVVKLSAAGTHLWSTYLGGTDYDEADGIATDLNGNCYVTGQTASSGWVSGGWQTTPGGGTYDGFVVKLSMAGAHVWSTYLDGCPSDYGNPVAVDLSGNAYVTGITSSSGWTSGGWQTAFGGERDGYVVKLSAAGGHVWSSYVGGTGSDFGSGIAVDSNMCLYLTGVTNSSGWVSGGWQTAYGGGPYDGFVLKICDQAEMVSVPAGTFTMGRTDGDDDATYGSADELPQHQVTLAAYQIGKYEVTNQQYCDVLNWALVQGYLKDSAGAVWGGTGDIYAGGNLQIILCFADSYCNIQYSGGVFSSKTRVGLPGSTNYSMDTHPVVYVTWYGSVAFCNWSSQMQGLTPCYDMTTANWPLTVAPPTSGGYRLPTEAEWERAAAWDGSKHWIYGFTNDTNTSINQCNDVWYDGSSYVHVNPLGLTAGSYTLYTSPVGWFNGTNVSPNGSVTTVNSVSPVGCYDMSGNVWEWCGDWYAVYGSGAQTNPTGPATGSNRVFRGGGWNDYFYGCRSACHEGNDPTAARNDGGVGFRLARTMTTQYALTYTAGANGSISGTTPQMIDSGGSGTVVTAVPNAYCHFVNWSDASTQNPRSDTNVTADISVTANFAIDTFTLTYTAGANGSISGTSPQTVNYGASGTAVTAVPNVCFHFVQWGDGSTENPRTDTNVTGAISVTANFALLSEQIIFQDNFNENTLDPAFWTTQGTPCQTVTVGNGILRIAEDATDAYTAAECSVVVDPSRPLQITRRVKMHAANNYFAGLFRISPRDEMGATPSSEYLDILYANDDYYGHYDFSGYYRDCSGAECIHTGTFDTPPVWDTWFDEKLQIDVAHGHAEYFIDGDLRGTCLFVPSAELASATRLWLWFRPYGWFTGHYEEMQNLVVSQLEAGEGEIETLTYTAGGGGSVSGSTSQTVSYGNTGTLVTAVANVGYHFVIWSDGLSTAARTDANVTANLFVTASFAINQYALAYSAGENGWISGTMSQTVDYDGSGTAVTAVPNAHYHFAQWSDGSTQNPRTDMNVTADISVTANFAIDTFVLTLTSAVNGTLAAVEQAPYGFGTVVHLIATPDAGCVVNAWTGADTEPSSDTTNTVTMTSDKTVSVAFVRLFPCDINPMPGNTLWRIEANELSAYIASWLKGRAWPIPPTDVPANYVSRAVAIWLNGEIYTNNGGSEPLCWVLPLK